MSDNEKNTREAFATFASRFEDETGGVVHLIHIIGTRWAYAAGRIEADAPFRPPQRVILNDHWALVFYAAQGVNIDQEKIRVLFEKQGV